MRIPKKTDATATKQNWDEKSNSGDVVGTKDRRSKQKIFVDHEAAGALRDTETSAMEATPGGHTGRMYV